MLKPVVVVSPGMEGNERKDQDRAGWTDTELGGVACLCDGTSASPYAEEAAQRVVEFVHQRAQMMGWPSTPAVFRDEILTLAQILFGLRAAAQKRPVIPAQHFP